MKKEILIRMQPDYDKCHHSKALKVAATVSGVESVTVTGRDRDLLLVIGDSVDEGKLTRKLNKEVGEAEIVELRTLLAGGSDALPPVVSADMVVALSPYHSTPGRSLPGGERITGPVAAALWPGEQAGYYPGTPSPCHYYYPSPMAGPGQVQQGGYGYAGSRYARSVARSHPANYSPMIARHDFRAVGRPRAADGGRAARRWRAQLAPFFCFLP
ncbi:uncharacterized protein LOC133923537 [Phragmites australis]|uniref:uncharacterized protein LOC133923537 n=1 Tax=Phragmites australis TaxID=29695 RepID=UPI002D779FDD|nr:uncharacterized protein LOC133923537 [Phragmites australis]